MDIQSTVGCIKTANNIKVVYISFKLFLLNLTTLRLGIRGIVQTIALIYRISNT
jgi:hypothetical protein